MNWKTIDTESRKKELRDEDENKLKIVVEDEDGNSIGGDEAADIVADVTKDEKKEAAKSATKNVVDDNVDDKRAGDSDKKEEKQAKSRAKERIQQVIKEKKELESKFMQEIESLKAQLSATNKESLETQQAHLEARIKDVKKAVTKAQEEGEFEKATDYLASLNELQTEKTVVDSYAKKAEREEPNKKVVAQEDLDDTEALAWSVRNGEWYGKDVTKTTLANRLSKKLDAEGFDPSSREYFEELDERMSDFISDNTTRKVDDNNTDDEDLQSSSKEEAKTKKKPQTSSGVSRTSSSVTRLKDGTISVRLNEREQAMAKKMGISPKDWAKSKARAEKAKDEHGYNMIFESE